MRCGCGSLEGVLHRHAFRNDEGVFQSVFRVEQRNDRGTRTHLQLETNDRGNKLWGGFCCEQKVIERVIPFNNPLFNEVVCNIAAIITAVDNEIDRSFTAANIVRIRWREDSVPHLCHRLIEEIIAAHPHCRDEDDCHQASPPSLPTWLARFPVGCPRPLPRTHGRNRQRSDHRSIPLRPRHRTRRRGRVRRTHFPGLTAGQRSARVAGAGLVGLVALVVHHSGGNPSSVLSTRPGAVPDARSASTVCCKMITAATWSKTSRC